MPAGPRRQAPTDPRALVDRYLRLCEERRLDEAGLLLAPDATLVFPGGERHASPAAMAAAARASYRWVRKRRDRWFTGTADEGEGDGTGAVTVVSLGTLHSEDPAGRPFDGIRYADVFVLRDGLIHEQHVYNDLPRTRCRT
ncbi:nuclear transport factor 2 family protein [Streptomyces radicis]|uniref:SnoaL-like domain-containing protein n=1 Tax=Streptomyces radicis TaxID=1750517 RepID=A0A3A9WI66_9ACTN|nr:nuclear transport factor 2 family protein [Streptomyces radicis]RKN12469.1 hypothetical protein D7319_00420 [Streptomyces radicis]RKN27763.1 hypothetical protein D7318_02470 [Streptomyces radicis]